MIGTKEGTGKEEKRSGVSVGNRREGGIRSRAFLYQVTLMEKRTIAAKIWMLLKEESS